MFEEFVDEMELEDVSDHNMLVVECLIQGGSEVRVGVGEVFGVKERCETLERKNADEANERISREEVKRCARKQKNGEAVGLDGIPYKIYKDEFVIDNMTKELLIQRPCLPRTPILPRSLLERIRKVAPWTS
ncbi:hypothetical protein E2C01_014104 [Portunus trituberculatus]|uniref:Uncharacterized protein n=1 Tax=Portunus trituberculatus TaxID=210409 RepID=A0A5B7DIA0_PORTR|nr:hypothetical protein [Portunus trituberculatus]